MTIKKDRSPAYEKRGFTCPYCGGFAGQEWDARKRLRTSIDPIVDHRENIRTAECDLCDKSSVWMNGKMIYPLTSSAPKPDNNMPDDVKELYEEARSVHVQSARSAAVLLRVAIEKLTPYLGETKGKLDTRIGNLQKKNTFDPRVINSFDIVRITANEGGAHDGLMDLTGAEGAKTVDDLFFAINYIVEKTIGDNVRLDQIYGKLPEVKREGVKNRAKPKDKT